MKLEGGCYCGSVRYVAEGEPMMKAQCHCRECQYITGGSPNMFVLMSPDGFSYTKGTPKRFARSDLEKPVTREFCAECGTHLVTRPTAVPRHRFESRHVRRSQPVWWPADGDLHHRQAGFPSNPRWHAELRASTETMTRVQVGVGDAHNKPIRPDKVRRETARHGILLIQSPAPEDFSNRPLLSGGR
jgi:hypothetical protein